MAKKKTQSRKKLEMLEVSFTKEGKKRPFVLMWVEKANAERLAVNNRVTYLGDRCYDAIFDPGA